MNGKSVAIVDYRMGNLFSVKHACEKVGLHAEITSSKEFIASSDAVILPGVGAFGDAMAVLNKLDLIYLLKDFIASGKPFLGICLGMQMLMSESCDFGRHKGLDVIDGAVMKFDCPKDSSGKILKVPEVQWNRIKIQKKASGSLSLLKNISDGEYMYFVHSYYVKPTHSDCVATVSHYGDIEFASSVSKKNVFGCQFHPERSGITGLSLYENFANSIDGREI